MSEQFEAVFEGEFEDLASYAEQLAADVTTADFDAWPVSCIDWERAGRELILGGDIWIAEGVGLAIYVFAGGAR